MQIEVKAPEILRVPTTPISTSEANPIEKIAEPEVKPAVLNPIIPIVTDNQPKVSAFSLASIRAKKQLLENTKVAVKESIHLPTEIFSETDMLLHWNKYAQKLGDKGFKIMESLLSINDPTLNGTAITIELPNEGSKIDFESELNGLLGHLKGHLHNHDITINVIVNESIEHKFSFTAQDKYNRLNEINPNLELLRKTFDLDI